MLELTPHSSFIPHTSTLPPRLRIAKLPALCVKGASVIFRRWGRRGGAPHPRLRARRGVLRPFVFAGLRVESAGIAARVEDAEVGERIIERVAARAEREGGGEEETR